MNFRIIDKREELNTLKPMTRFVIPGESSGLVTQSGEIVFNPLLATLPLRLVIGACRPQTVRKILSLAGCAGVEEVVFLRTELTEKSYLSASCLSNPAEIQSELSKAMEQSGNPVMPRVRVEHRFLPFIEDTLVAGTPCYFDIFGASISTLPKATHHTILIGPEEGWSEFERNVFKQQRFSAYSLGAGILRVEHAVGIAVGVVIGKGE